MLYEPLYPEINMDFWEEELFRTKAARRLKHLAHFGAGIFLSPEMVGIDKLLAEAVRMHWQVTALHERESFAKGIDSEIIGRLLHSPSKKTKEIMEILLYRPYNIKIGQDGYPIQIRKVYSNIPLVDGELVTHLSKKAYDISNELGKIDYKLHVSYEQSASLR